MMYPICAKNAVKHQSTSQPTNQPPLIV